MRYIRQTILPQVGEHGQAKLANAKVLIVGAGGLGVPVLQYLVGAGVGHIVLVDADKVEKSNLHRQPLYSMADIGAYKVDAAVKTLKGLNPDVTITPVKRWLDPSIANELVSDATLVLDCADNFAVSFTLSDTCHALGKPLITASALFLNGYVAGVCGPAPSLRAIFAGLPQQAPTCSSAGILGPVVGTIGLLQAQMALAYLLDFEPSPLGKMLTYDAQQLRFADFRFDNAPEPASENTLAFVATSEIQSNDLLIDIRDEATVPFHPQAQQVSLPHLQQLQIPAHTGRIIVACNTGLRAYHAAEALKTIWQGDIALLSIPKLPEH